MTDEDDGVAISYKLLPRGTPIVSRDGIELGTVDRVLDNGAESFPEALDSDPTGGARDGGVRLRLSCSCHGQQGKLGGVESQGISSRTHHTKRPPLQPLHAVVVRRRGDAGLTSYLLNFELTPAFF